MRIKHHTTIQGVNDLMILKKKIGNLNESNV